MLGLLPTGFGKSLIFQLYPRIFELVNGRKNCHVIIVSALNAITEEQVQELADIGISAVAVGDSRETDENMLKGEYKLVFGSAEMNGFFTDCLYSWDLTFGFDFVIFFAHVTRGPK